jgi:hypothetical protein
MWTLADDQFCVTIVPTNTSHRISKEIDMELLTFIVTILAILALVDAVAIRKGVDSRDRIGDDWTRRTFA